MAETASASRPTYVPPNEARPLSPHLQIWGWTVTMATSITHRATGIALYAGTILLTAWLASAAIGEGAFAAVTGLLGSPVGLVILFGFTWAQMYHLSNGVRHLIWDSGKMLSRSEGKKSAWFVYGASVVLTLIIWAIGLSV